MSHIHDIYSTFSKVTGERTKIVGLFFLPSQTSTISARSCLTSLRRRAPVFTLEMLLMKISLSHSYGYQSFHTVASTGSSIVMF